MGKRKKEKAKPSSPKKHDDFGHEIWGIIFIATAILVLISLVSHFIQSTNNILGYYFGTALSRGLIYFFGPVCVFVFPVGVGTIGVWRFRGELIDIRSLFFGVLLTLELCLLLAVHYLPAINSGTLLHVQSNSIGLTIVKLIQPVFGRHTFGPYFITSLIFMVTGFSAFRIPPQRIVAMVITWIGALVVHLKEQWRIHEEQQAKLHEEQAARREERAKEKEQKRLEEEKKRAEEAKKAAPAVEKKVAETPLQPPSAEKKRVAEIDAIVVEPDKKDIASVEDDARQRLEQELAAFRAKRTAPIQIMAVETEEVEVDEADPADDAEIPEHILKSMAEDPDFSTTTTQRIISTKPYVIPDPSIIPDPPPLASMIDKETIEQNSMTLEKTLMNFGVEGKVVFVSPGPVVTRYEIELAPGVKVSKVVNLHDDLSMAVGGQRIRIEAPIPGKSAVGIELPNGERQIVHFKHVLLSDAFKKTKAKLPVIIGSNVSGAPYVTDVSKMPHVLIAGQTGSGKSVCINSLICSLLMTMKPEDLRLIMIDPKKVELAFYEGIPHLLSPVVTESKEAVKALQWGVIEMERRYRILAKVGARNIESFNSRIDSDKFASVLSEEDNKKLPFIVIIVDELADLMMTASKDVEVLIQRIAQLARAVGIHLIVATQRPSVDIITGPIKANLTSRIGFRTIQSTDSRTILGHVGAEKLLGMGDMLFLRNGAPEIERFHGAFISEDDVEKIVANIRSQNIEVEKIESFIEATGGSDDDEDALYASSDRDDLFEDAARTIVSIGQGSTSLLQRRMKIGYARAGRLMDELERAGFVGPPDGSKAREVLVMPDEIDGLLERIR